MKIETLCREWQALQPLLPENQAKLDRKFMLEFNYNSNHLEGNTLTYGQTEVLLLTGNTLNNAPMRDWEEMKAHNVALKLVKQEAKDKERPLTERFIKDVHKILLCEDYDQYIIEDGIEKVITIHAGTYKQRPNSVITKTGERFEYASPEETPALMADLVQWYNDEVMKSDISPIELASLFHYRYIRIHPFDDGNGRIARLMVNYILYRSGLPMLVVKTEDKHNYLAALGICDARVGQIPSKGAHAKLEDIKPLVDYLKQCLEQALIVGIKAAVGEDIEEEDDIQKKLIVLARNAQAQKGNIKRIDRKHILEIYDDFIIPFSGKIKECLSIYSQFYGDNKVDFYKLEAPFVRYYKEFRLSFENNNISEIKDKKYLIKLELESPSALIPADSKETVDIWIKFDDEKYELQMLDNDIVFKYGVLPTDTEQKNWLKNIKEYIYSSIERKVAEEK